MAYFDRNEEDNRHITVGQVFKLVFYDTPNDFTLATKFDYSNKKISNQKIVVKLNKTKYRDVYDLHFMNNEKESQIKPISDAFKIVGLRILTNNRDDTITINSFKMTIKSKTETDETALLNTGLFVQHINAYEMQFIDKLHNIRTFDGDNIYYDFSPTSIFNIMDNVSLKDVDVSFQVSLNDANNNLIGVELLIDTFYYGANCRRNMARKEYESSDNLHQYKYNEVSFKSGDKIIIDTSYTTNGFFIDKLDIDEIQKIEIFVDGAIVFCIDDNFYVKRLCKTFNNGLIYLPLNNNEFNIIDEHSISLRLYCMKLTMKDTERDYKIGIGIYCEEGYTYCNDVLNNAMNFYKHFHTFYYNVINKQ